MEPVSLGTVYEFSSEENLSGDLRGHSCTGRYKIQTLGTLWTWMNNLRVISVTNISSMLPDRSLRKLYLVKINF